MEVSVILGEKEAELLSEYMKDNNIKSKAKAVRKCIRFASKIEQTNDLILDIDNKTNTLLYRENFMKKLLEQFYANMEFPIEQDVKSDESLKRFYENNN